MTQLLQRDKKEHSILIVSGGMSKLVVIKHLFKGIRTGIVALYEITLIREQQLPGCYR